MDILYIVAGGLPNTGAGGAVFHGTYIYTETLLALDVCPQVPQLPAEYHAIITPLHADAWADALRKHPDRAYVDYLVRGIL